MAPGRASWRVWLPAGLVAVAIFVASSLPATSLPLPGLFAGQDKLEHLLAYAVLAGFVARAWRRRTHTGSLGVFLLATAAAVLYGISDELHQSLVPGRTVDPLDLLADSVGGALGAAVEGALARLAQRSKVVSRT